MIRRRGCRRCLALGLLCSVLIHGATLSLMLGAAPTPVTGQSDAAIDLDLAVFADSGGAEAATTEPAQPASQAEPNPDDAIATPVKEPREESVSEPEPAVLAPPAKPQPKPTKAPRQLKTAPAQVSARPPPKPKPEPKPPRPQEAKPPMVEASPSERPRREARDTPAPVGRTTASRTGPADKDSLPSSTRPAGVSGPSAAAAATSAAARADAERAYLAELARAIEGIARRQRFPNRGHLRHATLVANVAFVIQSDGRISGVTIDRSTGDPELDRAAIETLHRLDRFKPIPAALGRSSWPITVPIRINLP